MNNELQIFDRDGQLLVDSRDVAVMVGKKHAHLLRDINGYLKVLDPNPDLDSANFFIKASYTDNQNQERPCFYLTKKGCDMVANKLSGEKGILFTAAYVTKFEQMEKQLISLMSLEMSELKSQMYGLLEWKEMIGDELTLTHGQQQTLHHQIKKHIETIKSEYDINKRSLYARIHSNLRKAFEAPSYIFVKREDYADAMKWVKNWRPLI